MGACPERIISFPGYNVNSVGSMIKAIEVPDEDEQKSDSCAEEVAQADDEVQLLLRHGTDQPLEFMQRKGDDLLLDATDPQHGAIEPLI